MNQLAFDEETSKRLEAMYQSRDVMRRQALVREAPSAKPGSGSSTSAVVRASTSQNCSTRSARRGLCSVSIPPQRCSRSPRSAARDSRTPRSRRPTRAPCRRPTPASTLRSASRDGVRDDVEAAVAEIHRVLRPGGRVVLWDVDWETVSFYSRDPERMERALQTFDKHLAHPALPQRLAALLRSTGVLVHGVALVQGLRRRAGGARARGRRGPGPRAPRAR